jgi:hypothetical protein
MSLGWNLLRLVLVAVIVVAVAEVSRRYPRAGAVLLSLPLVSLLAFTASWLQHRDLPAISKMARETLVLVPLSLPFFVPFALASRWGLGYWSSFAAGTILAAVTILSYLTVWPQK